MTYREDRTGRRVPRALAWTALALVGTTAFGIALSWAAPDTIIDRPQPWEAVLVWLVLAAVPAGALWLWRREAAQQRLAALARAERRLSAHAETGDDLLGEMDANGVLTYFGPNVEDYLGYTPRELIGRPTETILPPHERDRATRLIATSAAKKSGWTEEPYAFLTNSGEELDVVSSGVAHVGADGKILGFTGTVRRAEAVRLDDQARREKRERVTEVLDKHAVRTVFQPIADVATGAIIGAEALSRFPGEPKQGPDVWFADAAEVGLSAELELFAIEVALEQARQLPPHLYVSVNLSPATLYSPRLLQLVQRSRWQPARLVVEITEHVSIEDYGPLAQRIDELRSLGLRLAVDDAGAGYASFRHILGLSPDYIKLDRALIDGMDDDPARRALVSAVVTFGREVSAVVVAEGIETPAELRTARLLDVDAAQGYFIGRPAPAGPEWALQPPTDSTDVPTIRA
jgi:PAS domain S-box-containing protein